ncbi:MAG: zinc metallopeptidase [Saprospiraceae bacterium]|nr:zinc metallopeptidase [Saprospiraceae bacterium]MCB9326771.1 zinc metallopeptidase [Lewinellaceae bacterium]
MGGYFGYIVLTGILSLIGMAVGNRLKSKFAHYSKIPVKSGKSGREIAETMLRYYNINDVVITEGQGALTDHYNPLKKVVMLSPEVYHGRSIASAAVAAHECGHAVQHANAYAWLKMRSAIVPVVSFAAKAQQFLLLFALGIFGVGNNPTLILITIATFAITALFSFITLPVEFDASRRALAWLDNSNEMAAAEHEGAKDALWWAAMTYVSAALSALVVLLYFIMRYRD